MHMQPALIELAHCSLILGARTVLDEVSFSLRPGERWVLIGANGSGKTLLLKMLRGDVWPTPMGRERRCYRLEGEVRSEPRGAKGCIAYVGPERQDKYLRYGWDFTVAQVVTSGLFDEDVPLTHASRAQGERVARLLRRFGLWGLRRRKILGLSYGQRRLVLVARAFAGKAKVLLLDEVFNGLDAGAKETLRQALERRRGGPDWVLTSHRPQELPANITHVARICEGRIVWAGPAQDFRSAAGERAAARKPAAARTRPAGGPGRMGSGRVESVAGAAAGSRPAKEHGLEGESDARGIAWLPRRGARSGLDGAWLVRIRDADLYRDYRRVIRQLNWTLIRGQHWAVLGANGCGKSTLLSLLYGDLHPALGGSIERRGVAFGTHIERWKHRVGWVSPELQADHHQAGSLEQIVMSGRYASVGLDVVPTVQDRHAARRWMRFFGIELLRERGPREVSYGQMRLALLARAMVSGPRLLLLDEPCTGLDAQMRERVLSLIERLAGAGTQIVMAVHDAEDIVPSIRRILEIRRGKPTFIEIDEGHGLQTITSAS